MKNEIQLVSDTGSAGNNHIHIEKRDKKVLQPYPTNTFAEKIALQTKVNGIAVYIFEKFRTLYDGDRSIPQTTGLTFYSYDPNGMMYTFRVGSNFILELPHTFIESTKSIDISNFDFLGVSYEFSINNKAIPLVDWFNSNLIDKDDPNTKTSDIVGKTPEEIERIMNVRSENATTIRGRLFRALQSIDRTLFPPKIEKESVPISLPTKGQPPLLGRTNTIKITPRATING